ncbi:hypothetical protein NDU88_005956 [Pleurodeles waltl]|uniref:Uncharacterized protein n=1 Tax=Pleurodeles waltl TaxID=8319 RepID=A0AAV7PGW8_PLEWA|nr:hypothetical protein NDU88_005956 [Pleurodeles waltl]
MLRRISALNEQTQKRPAQGRKRQRRLRHPRGADAAGAVRSVRRVGWNCRDARGLLWSRDLGLAYKERGETGCRAALKVDTEEAEALKLADYGVKTRVYTYLWALHCPSVALLHGGRPGRVGVRRGLPWSRDLGLK